MRYIIFLVILSQSQSVSFGADWAQWRGPNRDCKLDEPVQWPESLEEGHLTRTWSVPLGPGYSGPIVAGSRVFVTETKDESHEVVRALDRATGKELWATKWPGATKVPFFAAANGSWIRSTPSCDGKHLYVAGIRDVLVCLDVATGDEQWRVDFAETFKSSLPAFGTVCSPLIDGDDIYLQAAASVVKINKEDGAVVWRGAVESGGLLGAGMGASPFSSPVLGTLCGQRQLVVQSRSRLFGLNLQSGETLWAVDVPAFRGMNILTPHLIADTVFTSNYGGGTFLFDIHQQDGVFVASERWKTKTQGYMSSPATIDGHVYLQLRNQRFTCINPADGDTKWTTRPFGKYWSMAVNGDQILALDQKGILRLIKATPDAYSETSARQVSESETWAHVGIADAEIYVRELNAVTAWNWK